MGKLDSSFVRKSSFQSSRMSQLFFNGLSFEKAREEYEADSLADGLNGVFNREVEIPRIRHGKKQTLDTLISEEALLLAKYLRNERQSWNPRIASLPIKK